jgi:O-antigen ligase
MTLKNTTTANIQAWTQMNAWAIYAFLFFISFGFVIRHGAGAATVIGAIWASVWLYRNKNTLQPPPAIIKQLAVLLALPFCISLPLELIKTHPDIAQLDEQIRMALGVPLLFYLRYNLTQSHFEFFKVSLAFSAFALIVVDWELIDLGTTGWNRGPRFATFFVDPNSAGLIGCLLLCWSASLFSNDYRTPTINRKKLVLWLTSAAAGAYILINSDTRVAWLAAVLIALFFVVLPSPKTSNNRRTTVLVKLGALTLGLALALQVPVISARVVSAGEEATQWLDHSNPDTSLGLRLSIYRAAIRLRAAEPLKGHDVPELRAILKANPAELDMTPTAAQTWFDAGPHNHFLEKGVSNGLKPF